LKNITVQDVDLGLEGELWKAIMGARNGSVSFKDRPVISSVNQAERNHDGIALSDACEGMAHREDQKRIKDRLGTLNPAFRAKACSSKKRLHTLFQAPYPFYMH